MARRGRRGFFGWIVLLTVLVLAGIGGYVVYTSPVGQSTSRVVEKAVSAGADQAKQESSKSAVKKKKR